MVNRMETKTLLDSGSPLTQSIEAVRSLLSHMGRGNDLLPTILEMPGGRCKLVLSSKQDAYYTVTAKACSCPSAYYRPEQPCKHRVMYSPEASKESPDTSWSPARYRPIESSAYDPALNGLWKPPKPVFRDEIVRDYDGPVVA